MSSPRRRAPSARRRSAARAAVPSERARAVGRALSLPQAPRLPPTPRRHLAAPLPAPTPPQPPAATPRLAHRPAHHPAHRRRPARPLARCSRRRVGRRRTTRRAGRAPSSAAARSSNARRPRSTPGSARGEHGISRASLQIGGFQVMNGGSAKRQRLEAALSLIWCWRGGLEGKFAEASGRLVSTWQHTALAEAPPTGGGSGARTSRLVGSERCSWMQRSARAGGGRSTHTIAGTRLPLSSARRSAASCVGWHGTARHRRGVSTVVGHARGVSSSPAPETPACHPVRGTTRRTLRHGLFHALIGTGGSPSARASTSQLAEQTTTSSMPLAASSAVRLRSKARANSP
eukprot:scaffold82538_cov60-Phaeocystis_antarctica.AAC.3